jgi:hypothetical protein
MAHGGPDALSEALHSDLNAHPYTRGFDIVHDVFELSPGAFANDHCLEVRIFCSQAQSIVIIVTSVLRQEAYTVSSS